MIGYSQHHWKSHLWGLVSLIGFCFLIKLNLYIQLWATKAETAALNFWGLPLFLYDKINALFCSNFPAKGCKMFCKAITRYTRPTEEDGERGRGVGKYMNWRNEQSTGIRQRKWPGGLPSWAAMSPEKKQRTKWGCNTDWGQGGLCEPRVAGSSHTPGQGLRAEVWAEPIPWGQQSHSCSHSLPSSLGFQSTWKFLIQLLADTGTGSEEMQQWGTNTSQHPAINISTQHPWEQQSLASCLTKSAKIIIFERKKSD